MKKLDNVKIVTKVTRICLILEDTYASNTVPIAARPIFFFRRVNLGHRNHNVTPVEAKIYILQTVKEN